MDQYEEYTTLIKEYDELINRLIASRVEDRFFREDLKQEVLLIVFYKLHTLKNKDSFKFWLIKIVKNVCYKYYKSKSRFDIPIEDIKLSILIDKKHVKRNSQIYVVEHINDLSLKNKDVIIDFYYNNLKINEISSKHNIPVGTVKRRLFDARKKLKERIEKDEN